MTTITSHSPAIPPMWRIILLALIAVGGLLVANSMTYASTFDNIKVNYADDGDEFMTRGLKRLDGTIYGIYWNDTTEVFVANGKRDEMRYGSIHERSHYLWFVELTEFERNTYCQYLVLEGASASTYGLVSCSENFAENFTFLYGNTFRSLELAEYILEGTKQKEFVLRVIERFTTD